MRIHSTGTTDPICGACRVYTQENSVLHMYKINVSKLVRHRSILTCPSVCVGNPLLAIHLDENGEIINKGEKGTLRNDITCEHELFNKPTHCPLLR